MRLILRRVMTSAKPVGTRTRPVVAVIGTTGVGKSDLAIALAESLQSASESRTTYHDGVVISADSMQIYKGLDVITNKITKEEMKGVRHWGLDLVKPGQGNWEMGRWCIEADAEIAKLSKGTLPIVCGGTHYFIQHFLFPPSELSFDRPKLATESKTKSWNPPRPRPPIPDDLEPELKTLLETFWTDTPVWPVPQPETESGPSQPRNVVESDDQLLAMYRLLTGVDPKEAGRWHWRDGRKVRRGLERWWERGNGEGQEKPPSSGPGRRARFRTLVLWVYEPLDSLRPRLSRRVDKMVDNGLLREIAELRQIAKELYGSADEANHTEGIFQSIGYKEFAGLDLNQEDPAADPAFETMLERMKLSTHQYARSQIKWISKQLLPAIKEARSLGGEVEVYAVRGGQEGHQPSIDLLNNFLAGEGMPSATKVGHPDAAKLLADVYTQDDQLIPNTVERQSINQRKDCIICGTLDRPYSVSMKDWDTHIRSKPHKIKQNILNAGGKEAWIEMQRAKGLERKQERQAVKLGLEDPVNEG